MNAERRPGKGGGHSGAASSKPNVPDDGGLFGILNGAYGRVSFTEAQTVSPALSGPQQGAQGVRRATQADPGWLPLAIEAVRELAATGEVFDADVLCARVGEPPSAPLMGAAFRVAHRHGWIELAGVGTSCRPQAHNRMTRMWRGRRPGGGGA